MNDRMTSPEDSAAHVDLERLLRAYYRAEMPHPWPRLNLPSRSARRPGLAQHLVRYALAACVVLGLLTYWGLAGQFNSDNATPGLDPLVGPIGLKSARPRTSAVPAQQLSPVEHQVTPAGNDAKVFEEDTPTGRAMILIGPSNAKGPR